MPESVRLAPSILAADPLRLIGDVETAVRCGADELHVDIMDGHFVPNITYGPALVRALRRAFPALWLDVHLMVSEPARWIRPFAEAGASALTAHVEALRSPDILSDIAGLGVRPGISLKPATPVAALDKYLPQAEYVLVMTVEPGFGGQKLMSDCADKVRQLRERGYCGRIGCDGGVTPENAPALAALGADTLIMGTAFFRAEDPRKTADAVHAL